MVGLRGVEFGWPERDGNVSGVSGEEGREGSSLLGGRDRVGES